MPLRIIQYILLFYQRLISMYKPLECKFSDLFITLISSEARLCTYFVHCLRYILVWFRHCRLRIWGWLEGRGIHGRWNSLKTVGVLCCIKLIEHFVYFDSNQDILDIFTCLREWDVLDE